MNEDKMPLFLINGFLEAGKTQFIKFTMQQDYFQTEGKTLLIVCEEGEEEYDEELLKQTHTLSQRKRSCSPPSAGTLQTKASAVLWLKYP